MYEPRNSSRIAASFLYSSPLFFPLFLPFHSSLITLITSFTIDRFSTSLFSAPSPFPPLSGHFFSVFSFYPLLAFLLLSPLSAFPTYLIAIDHFPASLFTSLFFVLFSSFSAFLPTPFKSSLVFLLFPFLFSQHIHYFHQCSSPFSFLISPLLSYTFSVCPSYPYPHLFFFRSPLRALSSLTPPFSCPLSLCTIQFVATLLVIPVIKFVHQLELLLLLLVLSSYKRGSWLCCCNVSI